MLSWKFTLEAFALGSFLAVSTYHHRVLPAAGVVSFPAVLVSRALALERPLGKDAVARRRPLDVSGRFALDYRQPCRLGSQRPRQPPAACNVFQCSGWTVVFQRALRVPGGEVRSRH